MSFVKNKCGERICPQPSERFKNQNRPTAVCRNEAYNIHRSSIYVFHQDPVSFPASLDQQARLPNKLACGGQKAGYSQRFPQTLRVKLLRFFMVGSVICTVFALLLLYCSFETLQYACGGDYVRYWGDFSVFPLYWYCRHPCANACQVLHTLFLFNLRSTDPKYGVKIMKRMCKHCLPGTAVQV